MPSPDPAETRARAELPTLDVEIVHRPNAANAEERLVIMLREVPADEAFARWLLAMNPMLFWLRWMQAAWSMWLPVVVPVGDHEPRR